MAMVRRAHPSGRPLTHTRPTRMVVPRLVPDGPLTPGLRVPDVRTEAIGFTAGLSEAHYDDDYED